jgi:hypothetical protein
LRHGVRPQPDDGQDAEQAQPEPDANVRGDQDHGDDQDTKVERQVSEEQVSAVVAAVVQAERQDDDRDDVDRDRNDEPDRKSLPHCRLPPTSREPPAGLADVRDARLPDGNRTLQVRSAELRLPFTCDAWRGMARRANVSYVGPELTSRTSIDEHHTAGRT